MPKRYFFILIFLSVSAISFQSCNDQPINIPLFKDTTQLYGTSSQLIEGMLYAEKTEYYQVSLYFRPKLFIGQWEDYKSITLLRFYNVPDTLSYLTKSDIISVKLTLTPDKYQFGDLDDPRLEFDVMNLDKQMDIGLEWRDVFGEDGTSSYFDENSKVRFDTTLSYNAINTEEPPTYSIDLPKETAIRWFYLQSNYKKDTSFASELKTNFQIALVPTENSKIIQRFDNSNEISNESISPKIRVKYKNKLGDTISVTFNKASSYTLNNTTEPEENTLTIQNGFLSRFYMEFDLSSIPKNKSIIRTEFRLTLDTSKSKFGTYGSDSLIISTDYYVDIRTQPAAWSYIGLLDEDKETFIIPKLNPIIEAYLYSEDTLITNKLLKLSFTNIKDGNSLRSTNELYLFNRFVFYGSDAIDPKKRPQLKIIYADRANY